MTLKDLIEQNPNATLNMMTPGGYVLLNPELSQKLLHGEGVIAHAGCSDVRTVIPAAELLPQEVVSCNAHKSEQNYFYLLTAWEPEQAVSIQQMSGMQL